MTIAEKIDFINRYCNNSVDITFYNTVWTLSTYNHHLFNVRDAITDENLTNLIDRAYTIVKERQGDVR